jgi:hypothetical protein
MPIDSRARDITTRLLAAELRRRDRVFAHDIAQAKEEMGARGAMRSGMTVVHVRDLAVREFRARAELNEWIDAAIDETFQLIVQRVNAETALLGGRARIDILQDETAALKAEFAARADLLVASLERRAKGTDPSSVFNFYGTVGAIQTGAAPSASVSQQLGQADLAALSAALERVAEAIARSTDVTPEVRGDVDEVLVELRSEIGKPRQNSLRLRQLASGVAMTIQTVASARPAYEALKTALLAFGIVVP